MIVTCLTPYHNYNFVIISPGSELTTLHNEHTCRYRHVPPNYEAEVKAMWALGRILLLLLKPCREGNFQRKTVYVHQFSAPKKPCTYTGFF